MHSISASPTPDLAKSVGSSGSRGSGAILWVVSVGLIVAGAGLTALSLLLPADNAVTRADDILMGARVIAASLGVLLTSLGGVLASYLVTRSSATHDAEAQHVRFLAGAARNLATIYHGLQDATAKRRNGSFAHEETYQESVLMSANSILAEYDSITSLSGRIQGAFRDSKQDLDEIRSVFTPIELITATNLAAQHASAPLNAPEPVTVTCPVCGSRANGRLTLRAGWTANAHCNHCKSVFLIHRRSDLTVYVGRVARTGKLNEPGDGVSDDENVADGEVPLPQDVKCPTCNAKFLISVSNPSGTARRICSQCATRATISVTDGIVTSFEQTAFIRGDVIGRRAAFPKVACGEDGYELTASFPHAADGDWVAICAKHLTAIKVSRSRYREWLATEDPAYLVQRLAHEELGGTLVLSEPLGS
jgi:transcription elongation factor Elf1